MTVGRRSENAAEPGVSWTENGRAGIFGSVRAGSYRWLAVTLSTDVKTPLEANP